MSTRARVGVPRWGRSAAGSRQRGPSAAGFRQCCPWAAALLGWALATGDAATALAADAGAEPSALATPSLQPLPELREAPLPRAEAADLAQLDRLVDQLAASEARERFEARRRVAEVDANWLPAIAERFGHLADTANKPALKALLERIREQARESLRESMKREGKTGAVITPDYLDMLVAHPDRSSTFLRSLTEVVAYSRMLEAIGTLHAARLVVSVYVRFGEFLRVDTQLALARMKDGSIAALIETTGHPVPRIAAWAERQLEDLGKAVASEAVQVVDPSLRADILRAYGKTRDLETARLLISFAASEHALIRRAAREAVTSLGEAGLWQLRDAYEKTVGERAPKDWPWDRLARELFAKFDGQRLAEIYALFNQGQKAEQRGELDAARQAFDQVLAWDPLFERGALMAPTYVAFAAREDTAPDAAILALRRAERLDPQGPLHTRALSLRLSLEARALLDRGIVDEVLIRRAHELDPDNTRAEALVREIEEDARRDQSEWQRYLAALVIAALVVIGTLVMAVRQRRAHRASAAAPH